ncbi:hypothetical protein DM01DRAFT_1333851 [Hesseltinella vesiculosa]|uniref:Phospholipid/glycerol acyltransferase domain-containing protein n=1 Tax=Hesseltinella vesiculosa TaxID=101127 RepID=A0A1X2GPB1_9FUNG|nr:hypothetical protein DM01DRAFT_1333851 [Hesseltinella vesiculosa]
MRPFSRKKYQQHLSTILASWAQSLFGLMQFLAPCNLILYFDESCPPASILTLPDKTSLDTPETILSFPDRTIVIANHQIYADWIYVWFLSYLAGAHGYIKIMLKNSLKYVPFFGAGMCVMDFIFMKRRLIDDKDTVINNLKRSVRDQRPMWLLLFPEGTVICEEGRERSQNFAAKNNLDDNLYTLLPRSTGLKLCLDTLEESIEWMYDLTIGYPGIQPDEIPEDTLRLKQIFSGHGPRDIHLHLRRYHRSELPTDTDQFSKWLLNRWVEKDHRMEQFYEEGHFTSFDHGDDLDWMHDNTPLISNMDGANTLTIPMALHHPVKEFLAIWIYMLPYVPLIYILYRLVSYLLQ